MRISLSALAMLGATLIITGCQSTGPATAPADEAPPPKNPAFESEMVLFNKQFPSAAATKYEDESIKYNNEKKFDEKGNCHGMSKYPVTIVLVLDSTGKVTSSTTDVNNAKAECFRRAYTGVQFPKPPTSTYRKAIMLK